MSHWLLFLVLPAPHIVTAVAVPLSHRQCHVIGPSLLPRLRHCHRIIVFASLAIDVLSPCPCCSHQSPCHRCHAVALASSLFPCRCPRHIVIAKVTSSPLLSILCRHRCCRIVAASSRHHRHTINSCHVVAIAVSPSMDDAALLSQPFRTHEGHPRPCLCNRQMDPFIWTIPTTLCCTAVGPMQAATYTAASCCRCHPPLWYVVYNCCSLKGGVLQLPMPVLTPFYCRQMMLPLRL